MSISRLPFTDAHVHFHDVRTQGLRYSWLEPGAAEDPVVGDYGSIRSECYRAEDFAAETRFQNVRRVVHVQAALGTADPVEETRWLDAAAERTGIPHGIVAYVDLTAADREQTLARHLASPRLRGVRDLRSDDYVVDPRWQEGFARLGELGLVCCTSPPLERAAELAALARRHPQTLLCVDHAGFPLRADRDYRRFWREAIERLAAAPNVVVKISGLGHLDPAWTPATLRPWVAACIDAFGVERAFFASSWPLQRLFSSYGDLLDAYAEAVSEHAPHEQAALLAGNAERVFRV